MSYVEHGPRIFLANKHNSGIPLMYGDYVLPKKRLEGRLKLHDSCSDIRAWSPNSLENSRYFRELGEHESSAGKIIPFNVVIDNIMRFNSQAQNELLEIKKELQKYKSLKLTVTQEQQLQNLDNTSNELSQKNPYSSEPLRNTLLNTCKSGTAIPSNSCLSIHIPCERYIQSNMQNVPATRNQLCQSYSCSLNEFDVNSALNNYNLISSCRSSVKLLPAADYSEKTSSCVEYIDVALQVEKETRDVEVQIDDQINKCCSKIATITAISQTSFTTKSSIEDSNATEQDKSSLQTNNHEDKDFECDTSYSECSQDIGSSSESNNEIATDSDFNLHNGIHKGIIIQKDSEIIVLKNELCVRDAELQELRDTNKHLENLLQEKEDCLHSQHGNLKILREKLTKLEDEHNYEVEDLKQKLYGYKYLMEQLKQELSEKCESCYLQSQEIEKLQNKLQGMEQEVKKSETCSTALKQLKNVLQEKEELKKQNYEQSCILADQEEDLKQLLKLMKEMSVTYNEQLEAKDVLENLKTEIHNKNTTISQYEDQLVSMKREISEFFNSLKNALNNLEELNEGCDSICTCTKCELDIGEESNSILYNIKIIMTRFQSYKIESQNLLQQVGDLKHYIEVDKRQTHLNQNLRNMICEDLHRNPEVNTEITTDTSQNLLNVRLNNSNVSAIEFQDSFNSINSGSSIYEETNKLDSHDITKEYQNYIIKLSKMNNMDNVEKEVVEYLAYFLFKLCSLIEKLQVYTEIERPLLIKQTYHFYEILKDTQSAINISEDITVKTRLISNLYNQHKEEYKKYNVHIEQLPNDLLHAQNKINEFIETILYQLLNDMLDTVKKDLYDEKIDHAFEIHLKSCMDRINTALQGAGDQRIHIVETIEEQQKELQKRDIEIAALKNEVAKQLVRIGEGDCLNEEKSGQGAAIKEQLSSVTAELNKKDVLILKLEEQYHMLKNELFVYNKDCTALKKRNKNLENMRSKLMKTYHQSKRRSLIKDKQIKNLIHHQTHELSETKELKMTLENKINQMEIKLVNLRSVNSELEKRFMQANMIISRRDEAITTLKNSIDKNDHSLPQKITEYENTLGEKRLEIMKLENENKLLNEKLKSIESRLVEMNETILSLTEENDKINIINTMQEDLTKLDKNEKKLKVELNNLKAQLLTDQNNNRKLDNNLDTFLRENETLKKNVEYWTNENNELSSKLSNKMIKEKLKFKLCDFSNKIYERILTLKNQFDSEKNVSTKQVNNQFQDKYKYQNREVVPSNGSVYTITKDLTLECADQREEIKENEIEELETKELNSDSRKERIFRWDSPTFEQFNSSDDDSLKMWYRVKYLESENNKNENETEKLLKEIEINNAEVKHCKEVIKHLAQENADLRAVLKSQIEEYQHKLMLMKKNYDSSLNALCERHKANVETLQQQFEDNMKNERSFDSESWLQTLNMEELMELYARISAIITDKYNVIHMENESLHDNDLGNQFYTKTNETQRTFQLSPINLYEKESSLNKIVPSIIKEGNSYLQNQWQFVALGDTQKYLTVQTPDDKLNLEYNFGEQRVPDVQNEYEKERQAEKIDSSFDKQRWNFIKQCSAYHKLSNAYEYSRILHTD